MQSKLTNSIRTQTEEDLQNITEVIFVPFNCGDKLDAKIISKGYIMGQYIRTLGAIQQ